MANQENNENPPQIEQQYELEAPQQTIKFVIDNSGNGDINVAPIIDTGSANKPGRDNDRKMFVGGLSRETTEEDLRTYFIKYGTLDSVKLIIDPQTQRSKGFAFIVFSSGEAITKVTSENEHVINNKKVDTQLPNLKQGKIFVGGITPELSEEDIKKYFGQFGNVVEVQIPFDKVKNQKKNFCFVVFSSAEVVEQLLKTPKISIKDVEVEVKKAKPKSNFGATARNFRHPQQERMGFGQQSYGNAYPVSATYNTGFEETTAYGGYAGNNYFVQNRNNGAGSTRGAGRGRGRRTMRGANNAGNGNSGRYQPY